MKTKTKRRVPTKQLVVERAVQEAGRAAWRVRNREAIAGYNARVEQLGVFSDRWRRF